MKRRVILIGTILCALASTACEEITLDFSKKGPEISLKTSDVLTEGQNIGVFMTEPVSLRNVLHSYTGGKLTPLNPIYWPKDMPDSSIWFRAYYPYTERFNTSTLVSFNTSTDQSSDSDFAGADLMMSSILLSPASSEGVFAFEHKMSRATVYLKNSSSKTLGAVTLKSVYPSVSINFKSGDVRPAGNITDIVCHLTSEKDGVYAYEAVFAPQNAKFNLSVILGGEEYLLSNPSEFAFAPGKSYVSERLTEFSDKTRRALVADLLEKDWADPDFIYEDPVPEGVEFTETTETGVYALDGDFATELKLYTPIEDQYSTISESQYTNFRFMCPELGYLFAVRLKGTSFVQGSSYTADLVSCGIEGAQGKWSSSLSVVKNTTTQIWLKDSQKNLGYVIMK